MPALYLTFRVIFVCDVSQDLSDQIGVCSAKIYSKLFMTKDNFKKLSIFLNCIMFADALERANEKKLFSVISQVICFPGILLWYPNSNDVCSVIDV